MKSIRINPVRFYVKKKKKERQKKENESLTFAQFKRLGLYSTQMA